MLFPKKDEPTKWKEYQHPHSVGVLESFFGMFKTDKKDKDKKKSKK